MRFWRQDGEAPALGQACVALSTREASASGTAPCRAASPALLSAKTRLIDVSEACVHIVLYQYIRHMVKSIQHRNFKR